MSVTNQEHKCEGPKKKTNLSRDKFVPDKSGTLKRTVSCLPRIVEKCSEPLSAQNVGNALYGLQGMSSDVEECSLIQCVPYKKNRKSRLLGHANCDNQNYRFVKKK